MNRLWTLVFGIILVCAICDAQVNFSPGWGKRALAQGGDAGCKSPVEALAYVYKLMQSELQKIVDCERLSNV